ncbi:hypothetical protein [Clostridium sp. AN503]|uniref:hypothetical protein n=1 Tax=Clostridium sp. AN503 TaxID=3160598 RepID=UPI003458E7EA
MIKAQDIKVNVTFTEGYQQRFTEACLRQLRNRERKECLEKEERPNQPMAV